jgi:hypothetical protein
MKNQQKTFKHPWHFPRRIAILLFLLIITGMGNHTCGQLQPITVDGHVTDTQGGPLPGITIMIKGTTTGTITDVDGYYTLNDVPGDALLVFSFIGKPAI